MSYAAVSIGYLYIATQSSVSLLFTAKHDDGLFISNAFSIFTTGWLPQYDQLALAKGPGFPMFMAINGILGLPITFSLAATFVGSALALSLTLNRVGSPPIGSFFVFGLIVSNFALFPTRLVRDNLYVSLTLFAVVLFLEIFVVPTHKKRSPIVLFLLGIIFGAFFLTREEFLWIFPFFLFLFAFFVWSNRKILTTFAPWGPVAIALLGFIVPVFGVGISNYLQYGVFQTNDFTQGSFPAAYSKLQEINSKSASIPYLPVPKSIREEVYNVSPKFVELKQALETDLLGWQTHSCQRYPETCGDYGGGWFAWAFRDAVAQAGYYSDATSANVFYSELTQEIQEACDRETISCKASGIPLVPLITRDAIERVSNSFVNSFNFALDQNFSFYDPTSAGSPEESAILTEFLGLPDPFTPEASGPIWVSGWYKPQGWIKTVCDGQYSEVQIERLPSADLVDAFGDERLKSQRFRVEVSTLLDCYLVQQTDNSLTSKSTLWRDIVYNGSKIDYGNIDSIEKAQTFQDQDRMLSVKKIITDIQSNVVKYLFMLSIISGHTSS